MTTEQFASNDFERAYRKAFWRKVAAWLTKGPNTLLPFYDLRDRMPIKGQHYIGLQQVPIDRIVGSLGRYRDFDREFLPRQTHTRQRWVNIDRARYEQVDLPPVELYKMGEIYFVKDGNHRVSVAREWEQEYIDAYVIELLVPVPLTPDMDTDDLELQKELAIFLEQTNLDVFDADIAITSHNAGQYAILLEHISFHQWLLGEQRQKEVSFQEAAISWYTNVYKPLVVVIEEQDILRVFPKLSVTDLYLWLVKYLWHLSVIYREESSDRVIVDEDAEGKAVAKLVEEIPRRSVVRLVKALKDTDWVVGFILQQERYTFLQRTHLMEMRPEAQIDMTVIGQYDILEKHIAVHRWFLGEQRQSEVSIIEAAASWYDKIYMPLIELFRQQRILEQFPGRTETDLYLWILEKQSDIKAEYDQEVSISEAAQALADEQKPASDEK
jgi:hypothetical protein